MYQEMSIYKLSYVMIVKFQVNLDHYKTRVTLVVVNNAYSTSEMSRVDEETDLTNLASFQ